MDCPEPRLTLLKGGTRPYGVNANGAARSDFLVTLWSALQFDGTPFSKTLRVRVAMPRYQNALRTLSAASLVASQAFCAALWASSAALRAASLLDSPASFAECSAF
jgi:hypothetical protein